eukprot:2871206-Pyramimonas_sp.AAC.1
MGGCIMGMPAWNGPGSVTASCPQGGPSRSFFRDVSQGTLLTGKNVRCSVRTVILAALPLEAAPISSYDVQKVQLHDTAR